MTGFLPPAGEASPGASPSHEASAMPRLDGRDAWITASVFAAALAVFTFNLGDLALWSRDETTYARIAQEMLRSGDWVTLRYGGINWFCHPPLYFWLVAVSTRLLASAELAARVPSALFGAGGVALAWLWGRTTFSARAGLLSAACMAINLQYFGQSRLCIIDTTFLFFLSLSMLGFWSGACRGAGRRVVPHVPGRGPGLPGQGTVRPALSRGRGACPTSALTRAGGIGSGSVPWVTGLLVALPLGGAWYVVEIALWGAGVHPPGPGLLLHRGASPPRSCAREDPSGSTCRCCWWGGSPGACSCPWPCWPGGAGGANCVPGPARRGTHWPCSWCGWS